MALLIAAAIGTSPLVADPPAEVRFLKPRPTADAAPSQNRLRLLPQPLPQPQRAADEQVRLVQEEQPLNSSPPIRLAVGGDEAAVDLTADGYFTVSDGGIVGKERNAEFGMRNADGGETNAEISLKPPASRLQPPQRNAEFGMRNAEVGETNTEISLQSPASRLQPPQRNAEGGMRNADRLEAATVATLAVEPVVAATLPPMTMPEPTTQVALRPQPSTVTIREPATAPLPQAAEFNPPSTIQNQQSPPHSAFRIPHSPNQPRPDQAQANKPTPPSSPHSAFRTPHSPNQPPLQLAQADNNPFQDNPFQDNPLTDEPLRPVIADDGPLEVLASSGELTVTRRRSKILRAKNNIYRVAVVDPSVCDVVQFTPREVSVIGRGQGATNVTFWFEDGEHRPITYLVRVIPDPEIEDERTRQYQILAEILAELFPDSKVHLQPVSDKLIVRGQAKDAAEAAQIMAVIRGQAVYGGNRGANYYGGLVAGSAAPPISDEAAGNPLPAANIINMLQIPGVQQVALRVKIAELNRTAAREFGVDLDLNFDIGSSGALILQTMLNAASGGSTSIVGNFDNDQLNFGIHYLQQRGVVRLLSEPTLVTLSGRPASFIAGGEFAVPTTVGVGGAAAVTTDFRAFGVILNFLPVVLDKDRLRLEISPEFSSINAGLTVGGTPGLNTRAVTTTVEMREGQTLAIAGLLEETMDGDNTGDIPFLAQLLGKRQMSRSETELIILVSPELVHPMEPEATPPLPGFDVTEPTDREFFLHGRLEGYPTRDHRSTVWPRLKQRYRSGGT
ncbi:MAG: pilus assembly protein N-terminal domain-containing protein, partial [Pirellulales bacterium]